MKIGLYNSCFENHAVSNLSTAVLANTLALGHDTEIISPPKSPGAEDLALSSGCSLERVSFRIVAAPPQTITDPNQPDRRYQAIRDWSHELTHAYDLFISFSDRLPIYCSAPRGVLVIQFPHDFVPAFYRRFWQSHLDTYQLKLVNSYYSRFWTNVFWELDCCVVYPPLPMPSSASTQSKLIVSIGSFDVLEPEKQLKMISVFQDLASNLPEWSLAIAGNADPHTVMRKSFQRFRKTAADAGVTLIANPTFKEWQALFGRASILWQGATLGQPLDQEPHNAEPYSLRVLQAMSSSCIPLVTNSGGFAEVIRHSETGFFYKDLSELARYTTLLGNNQSTRVRIAKAARKRAKDFRAERYLQTFLRHLENAFDIRSDFRASRPSWWRRFIRPNVKSDNRQAVT